MVKHQKHLVAKLLLKLWLGVWLVSSALTLGLLWLHTQDTGEVVFKAELTLNMLLSTGTMSVLVLSCGATTMFLNCAARIRNSELGSFFSFFLVPVVIIAWSHIPYFYAIMGPFLICLIISYLLFRYRVCRTKRIEQNNRIERIN